MTITEKLANFITETNLEDMPAEVVTLTKRAMIDTLGVALASSDLPAAKIITALAGKFGCTPVILDSWTRTVLFTSSFELNG